MFIDRLAQTLKRNKVNYAVTGGFAVALHGAVRGTLDVDVVLEIKLENFEAAQKALEAIGLRSKLPVTAKEVYSFRREYIKNRNLVAWSFVNPNIPSEIVDVIITHDLKNMGIKNIRSGDLILPVVAKKDLIEMKKSSGRPQDMEDIKALESIEG